MSTHFTMPSPSAKAGTSTKRLYESNTPSALGTPKDTSGQSMRSPGQAASKKAKVGEDGATNPPKELSKGGQWMVAKLDELERLYKVKAFLFSTGARLTDTGGPTRCDGCHTVPDIYSEAVGLFLFLPRRL